MKTIDLDAYDLERLAGVAAEHGDLLGCAIYLLADGQRGRALACDLSPSERRKIRRNSQEWARMKAAWMIEEALSDA